jgi:hypothetical protein
MVKQMKARLIKLGPASVPETAPATPAKRHGGEEGGKNMSLFVHKDADGTLTVGKDGKVLHFTDREALQIYTWMARHCQVLAKPLVNRDESGFETRPEGPTLWYGPAGLLRFLLKIGR